jgi:hypothetical protein
VTLNKIKQYTISIVNSLLGTIDTSTPKRQSLNYFVVLGFTEAYKQAQIEARRLKRIYSDNYTDKSREAYKRAQNRKDRVIRKVLKTVY